MHKLGLLLTIIAVIFFTEVKAANFTPGNVVVLRVGDGTAALTNAATAVFLDEYTPAGVFIQSIAVDTSASGSNNALTISGIAGTEGALSLSPNHRYLSFAGYKATPGYAAVTGDSTLDRIIGFVNAMGTVNTSTGMASGSAFYKGSIRSAVTNDSTGFWAVGSTGRGGTTGGMYYVPYGSITANPIHVTDSLPTERVVNIYNGQLYVSSGSARYVGANSMGTGLPTISGQIPTVLTIPTLNTLSPYGFVLLNMDSATPGVDVLYLADAPALRRGGSWGRIMKYSLVGGAWVFNDSLHGSFQLHGLTAVPTCTGYNFITTSDSAMYSFSDNNGYNRTIGSGLALIAAPGANTHFKGVALTPGSPIATPISATLAASPASIPCYGGTVNLNLSAIGGTGQLSFNWGGGVTSHNRTGVSAGFYSVTITDAASCTKVDTMTISQPDSMTFAFTPVNPTSGNNGSVTVRVTGGTSTYSYAWSPTTSSTDSVTGLGNGTYCVTVTDFNRCAKSSCVTITGSGINEIGGGVLSLSVAPNPAMNEVMILNSEQLKGTIQITDLLGRSVRTEEFVGTKAISVGALQTGVYLFTISNEAGKIAAKGRFVKQ